MGDLRFMRRATLVFSAGFALGCGNAPDTTPRGESSSGGAAGSQHSAAGASTTSAGGSAGSTAAGGTPGAGGTGGNPSSGGASGGMSSAGAGGAVKVTACDALGPAGQWEDITPTDIDLATSGTTYSNANFGTAALRLNPQDPAQIYLGTETWGFYGSTDCGATWTKLNTGRGASDMNNGNQWTMAVDPVDPKVIYSNSGFATGGVFKSTNGGIDWDNMLTESSVKGDIPYSAIPYAGFIGTFSMDPNDHLHLLS
ncbi:MAG TPA: hypothetical protein VGP93_11065, partial [Polyangiaceae bacterium]|nr:hypothetical protein [Polyangiaceae bacterium]